jgi:hypothetical protein
MVEHVAYRCRSPRKDNDTSFYISHHLFPWQVHCMKWIVQAFLSRPSSASLKAFDLIWINLSALLTEMWYQSLETVDRFFTIPGSGFILDTFSGTRSDLGNTKMNFLWNPQFLLPQIQRQTPKIGRNEGFSNTACSELSILGSAMRRQVYLQLKFVPSLSLIIRM